MASKWNRRCCSLILLGLCLICQEAVINAHVLVYRLQTNELIEEFNDLPAQFGPGLPPNGLKVFVMPAAPTKYGCQSMEKPQRSGYPDKARFVVVVSRGGNCTFETKVRVAQNATYNAVIVYNNEGDDLEQMSADNSTGIHIPSVFVGHTTGRTLLSFFTPQVLLVINDELPFNINTQLILPFSILIGLCFLIMVVYMIYKCIREQRRLRRYRLPKSMLKKIPILRYTKNNANIKYETCVICLEDFVEDDKLRVLPCSHPYHSHCIDPWLTQNRRVCPICKRKVFTKGETRSSRNRQPSLDSVTDTDDDTTPLLQQQQRRQGANDSSVSSAASTSNMTGQNNTTSNSSNSTTRHGTFRRNPNVLSESNQENNSSDDENALLDHQSPTHRRMNPFDRPTPDQAALPLAEPRPSLWSRINLSFLFNPTSISVAAPPFLDHIESGTTGDNQIVDRQSIPAISTSAFATPTSNNILNPNLSGSFKDDDDLPPHRSIYEPIAVTTPPAPPTNGDSVFLQTPTQGGIGVAALPHSEREREAENASSARHQFHI